MSPGLRVDTQLRRSLSVSYARASGPVGRGRLRGRPLWCPMARWSPGLASAPGWLAQHHLLSTSIFDLCSSLQRWPELWVSGVSGPGHALGSRPRPGLWPLWYPLSHPSVRGLRCRPSVHQHPQAPGSLPPPGLCAPLLGLWEQD